MDNRERKRSNSAQNASSNSASHRDGLKDTVASGGVTPNGTAPSAGVTSNGTAAPSGTVQKKGTGAIKQLLSARTAAPISPAAQSRDEEAEMKEMKEMKDICEGIYRTVASAVKEGKSVYDLTFEIPNFPPKAIRYYKKLQEDIATLIPEEHKRPTIILHIIGKHRRVARDQPDFGFLGGTGPLSDASIVTQLVADMEKTGDPEDFHAILYSSPPPRPKDEKLKTVPHALFYAPRIIEFLKEAHCAHYALLSNTAHNNAALVKGKLGKDNESKFVDLVDHISRDIVRTPRVVYGQTVDHPDNILVLGTSDAANKKLYQNRIFAAQLEHKKAHAKLQNIGYPEDAQQTLLQEYIDKIKGGKVKEIADDFYKFLKSEIISKRGLSHVVFACTEIPIFLECPLAESKDNAASALPTGPKTYGELLKSEIEKTPPYDKIKIEYVDTEHHMVGIIHKHIQELHKKRFETESKKTDSLLFNINEIFDNCRKILYENFIKPLNGYYQETNKTADPITQRKLILVNLLLTGMEDPKTKSKSIKQGLQEIDHKLGNRDLPIKDKIKLLEVDIPKLLEGTNEDHLGLLRVFGWHAKNILPWGKKEGRLGEIIGAKQIVNFKVAIGNELTRLLQMQNEMENIKQEQAARKASMEKQSAPTVESADIVLPDIGLGLEPRRAPLQVGPSPSPAAANPPHAESKRAAASAASPVASPKVLSPVRAPAPIPKEQPKEAQQQPEPAAPARASTSPASPKPLTPRRSF